MKRRSLSFALRKRDFFFWSEMGDSNSRHPAPKAGALPTALIPDFVLVRSTCGTEKRFAASAFIIIAGMNEKVHRFSAVLRIEDDDRRNRRLRRGNELLGDMETEQGQSLLRCAFDDLRPYSQTATKTLDCVKDVKFVGFPLKNPGKTFGLISSGNPSASCFWRGGAACATPLPRSGEYVRE